MRPLKLPGLVLSLLVFSATSLFRPAAAQNPAEPDFRGLLAGWGTYSQSDTTQGQFGFRLLPEFTLDIRLGAQKLSPYARPSGETGIDFDAINNNNEPYPPAFRDKTSRRPYSPSLSVHRSGLSDAQDSQANDAVKNLFLFSFPSPLTITSSTNTRIDNHAPALKKTFSLFIFPETHGPSPDSTNPNSSSLDWPGIEGFSPDSANTLTSPAGTSQPDGTSPSSPRHPSPPAYFSTSPAPPNPPASPAPPISPDPSHLTAELSFNIWGTLTVQQAQENKFRSQVKPYRLSLKYSTRRFEARLGLQKISFGSASLIRPLMWFDRIDPRDPIQLTDGVYGLLTRTYLSTRVNLWAWLLYGNNDPKGWELLPTQKRRPEFGARAQVPAGPGELALTVHHRRVDFNMSMAGSNPAISLIPLEPSSPLAITFPETRLALDGKWDLGVGLWIEATLTNQHSPYLVFPWQRAFTLGLDYTFGLGNGLYICGEFFQSETATAAFSGQVFSPFRARFLAGSASYPISLLDRLSAIIFYDAINHDLYSFLRWQRTYDRWSLNLMAFWNPKEFQIFTTPDQSNLFAGKGLQLMLLYNF